MATTRRGLGIALLALVYFAAPSAIGQKLTKSYPISPVGSFRFATFTSELDCGVGCTITHRIHSDNVDRLVVVKWLNANGSPLLDQVDNSYLSNFFDPKEHGGYLSASESQSRGITNHASAMGTADFRGTSSGTEPCGVGYVCSPPNGPEYYYFPSMFPAPANGPAPAGGRQPLGATTYSALTTTFSGVLLKPDLTVAQDTNGNDLRAPILTFNSEVEEASGQFHYIYTVSNATASDIAVTWTDAGINGSVLAHGSLGHEILSAGMPGTHDGAANYTLNRAYSSGVVFYAPAVPEPRAWAMWAAGLFFVVWFTLRANGIKPRARRRSEALLA